MWYETTDIDIRRGITSTHFGARHCDGDNDERSLVIKMIGVRDAGFFFPQCMCDSDSCWIDRRPGRHPQFQQRILYFLVFCMNLSILLTAILSFWHFQFVDLLKLEQHRPDITHAVSHAESIPVFLLSQSPSCQYLFWSFYVTAAQRNLR